MALTDSCETCALSAGMEGVRAGNVSSAPGSRDATALARGGRWGGVLGDIRKNDYIGYEILFQSCHRQQLFSNSTIRFLLLQIVFFFYTCRCFAAYVRKIYYRYE